MTIRRPLRVLLVDDGAADRELAREVFDQHKTHVVIDTCASGARALAFLQQPDTVLPDVILLDLNMPGMSGFDVLNALKSDARLDRIPVVILSSSTHPHDVERAYSLHASSFMTKQLDFGSFVQQIDAFVTFWLHVRTTSSPF
ncbi:MULTISPECIES: response regulator [Deinococcus]|uniref:Response regulator n=1 Tax=Deinococcus rufus TaxID=2136097 RepID=A0ABV7Z9D9_9DEIO|nr:response regulator [Deinococcus sp. AB2017081]WQE97335.1 response regulator [Deinococcus sp. AB2017081]